MTDMEKKVMIRLCAKIVAETDLYETDREVQNLIDWVCLSEQIKENNNTIRNLTGEYKKIEPDCREGVSAKNYRDKKALPLVEKLKEVIKNLTIKCVQLTEQGRKLTAKVDGQQKQISCLTDKVMEQSDTIDRLQEKAVDLGRLERHLGREQVQSIVERSKALEQAERVNKRPKRAYEVSR